MRELRKGDGAILMKILCANCREHVAEAEKISLPLTIEQFQPRPDAEIGVFYEDLGGYFLCPMCGFDIRHPVSGKVLVRYANGTEGWRPPSPPASSGGASAPKAAKKQAGSKSKADG